MADSIPLSKITVIIEEEDMVITTVFHKVYNPMLHVNHRDVGTIRLNADGAIPRPVSKADFMIEGVAMFDPEHGNFLETKREKKDA